MLQFEGDQEFTQPCSHVFAKLSDARFLLECVPGVEAVSKAEASEAICTIRPGFTFVRGTLELTLQVLERTPGTRIKVLARAKGLGSGNDVEGTLDLSPASGGTRLHWSAEAKNFTGLLKLVPAGLMQGAAQKVIADVWNEVEKRLVAQTPEGS